jgi:hypothetical protein
LIGCPFANSAGVTLTDVVVYALSPIIFAKFEVCSGVVLKKYLPSVPPVLGLYHRSL